MAKGAKQKKKKEEKKTQKEMNRENLQRGMQMIYGHPLFGYMCHVSKRVADRLKLGSKTYCLIQSDGILYANEDMYLTPNQWAYVIAHNVLHAAFGHFDAEKMPGYVMTDSSGKSKKIVECDSLLWNMACDIYVNKFLADMKFGQSIHDNIADVYPGGMDDEIKIYEYLNDHQITPSANVFGTAAIGAYDMIGLESPLVYDENKNEFNPFAQEFSNALVRSVSRAVSQAGGYEITHEYGVSGRTQAARWFVNHYPLLGGLASHFKIIEDYQICNQNEIHIAAIDVTMGEIYLNPSAALSFEEWKFVLAHEYLHAGLMHHERCEGRNPYLWNVSCDYVINGWLQELQIGCMPMEGILYDPNLSGLSAETIYDMILSDMKKYEKLDTFRGYHKGDVIGNSSYVKTDGISLDEFCRNAMRQGLEYHVGNDRGFVPAGLIEEIRALSMPPIPWDVALAEWFDLYFAPIEKHRSYERPSRRQASTPDIPRPSYFPFNVSTESRTFGVVIDTSGSMDAKSIGKALGAIASYAVAHEVPFVRVIFCDAAAYDVGYISPEDIAGRVKVKGRGGTRLQPGIDKLEDAKDFPRNGPILIITDGEIENYLDIRHEHAYLLPKGCRLPFGTKSDVFYFEE